MKRSILIWGTALVLVVIAIFVTSKYGNRIILPLPSQTSSPQTGQNSTTLPNQTTPPQVQREKAIDFTLTDLDGNTVSLSDYKGKGIYVNFFATWCPPCKREMPDIEKVFQKYKNRGLVVLAVDLGEDKATVKNFIQNNGLNFKVLLDLDQSVGNKYLTNSIPVSVFIDKNFNIAGRQVGELSLEEMEQYIRLLEI